MTAEAIASRLVRARETGVPLDWRQALPADAEEAFAVQDATLRSLGPVGGWKVGARSATQEPVCAPLPAAGLLPSGARLLGPAWRLRGIEVELALRVARDVDDQVGADAALAGSALADLFDAVVPVVEVVETRLAGWHGSAREAQLADLQSHGALLLGAPVPMPEAPLDLQALQATLSFNDDTVANTLGGNPAVDLWRLLAWLLRHTAARGMPLRRGQIVTTGSCTGMLFAPEGTRVQARLAGFGSVALQFPLA